jgi:hypothetical protein
MDDQAKVVTGTTQHRLEYIFERTLERVSGESHVLVEMVVRYFF